MRLAIGLHLLWKRLEVALCALVVPGLIIESSIANGWVYGGGFVGFLRGFFLEIVTYITARQAYLLFQKKNWFGCSLMALVSLSVMYVSAVNNLGWVLAGHDLAGLLSTLGAVMGNGPLYHSYQFFLAVCLPLTMGAIALVDLDHFFQHALEQDHLDNHALQVDERRMHRTAYQKAQRTMKNDLTESYLGIAKNRAQSFVDEARTGNLTFGAGSSISTGQLSEPVPPVQQLPPPGPQVTGTVWPADQGQWSTNAGQWSSDNGF